MELTYDLKFNVGYIRFREKTEKINSLKLSEELIIDISTDGTLYGIELLNVKDQIFGGNTKEFSVLNENNGIRKDIILPI